MVLAIDAKGGQKEERSMLAFQHLESIFQRKVGLCWAVEVEQTLNEMKNILTVNKTGREVTMKMSKTD